MESVDGLTWLQKECLLACVRGLQKTGRVWHRPGAHETEMKFHTKTIMSLVARVFLRLDSEKSEAELTGFGWEAVQEIKAKRGE